MQYETPLLTHLLRLCELALFEAQPVWVSSLQIFSSETPRHPTEKPRRGASRERVHQVVSHCTGRLPGGTVAAVFGVRAHALVKLRPDRRGDIRAFGSAMQMRVPNFKHG
jgi:hypothetical protein